MSERVKWGELHLRHYSHKPIGAVESRVQQNKDGSPARFKPVGLWVSVEGAGWGWREWCEAEDFSGGWEHVYDVTLRDDANILYLPTALDLDLFTHRYHVDEPTRWALGREIDWPRVAEEYDGIVIAPYHGTRRLHESTGWYYSWDCASGCIWNADAIAALRAIGVEVEDGPTDRRDG